MQRGEMYTVTAHRLPHGPRCGDGWHCRITGDVRDGKVDVQEMKVNGDRWKPGMSTLIYVAALRPLAVQVDLFGQPPPPEPHRRPVGAPR